MVRFKRRGYPCFKCVYDIVYPLFVVTFVRNGSWTIRMITVLALFYRFQWNIRYISDVQCYTNKNSLFYAVLS
ncbi:hypothetical protein Sbal223_1190 [Shewanella baltica OS223]|nr:hypothetical protein Sbal223_1190 [Shewanella baltica OS223]